MPALANLVLRAGLAFAFLYPPINALWNPHSWIGYLPGFLRGFIPDIVALHAFGVLEVAIALWILSGKKVFLPSLAAAGILVAIVILNLKEFEVVFRDLSIAAMAAALAIAHAKKASEFDLSK
jgi:uncharacterized membrane protein YphA (DoxX/SURF4 family)